MFKNLIYFDSEKVARYSALLIGERQVDIKKVRKQTAKSAKGSLPFLGGEYGNIDEFEGDVVDNPIFDCNKFEELLESKSKDNYFDITTGIESDIETIPRSAIIRFEGIFSVPEQFDMMDLINDFKPILTSQLDLENGGEEEIFNKVFGRENTKIPMFFDVENFEERVGFSKLNSKNLKYQLSEVEDFEGEEVIVIAKVLMHKEVKNTPIIVFDIMKDLFALNRALRREMKDREIEGIENIKSEESLITLEVLAIYQ